MKTELVSQSIRDGRNVIEYQVQTGELMDGLVLKNCKEGSVPGVLPMGAVCENQHNYMYAYIDQKETLSTRLSGAASRKDILPVFEHIADTLEYIEEAGINLAYMILDADYIYMDEVTGEPCLICMPGKNAQGSLEGIAEFFRGVLAHAIYSDSESGDYVAKLLTALNRNFTLQSFLQLIHELMKEEDIEPVAEPIPVVQPEPIPAEPVSVVQPEPIVAEPIPVVQPEPIAAEPVAAEPIPVVQPEPIAAEPIPVVQPEPVAAEPIPVVQPEPIVAEPRPIYRPEDVGIQPVQPVQPMQKPTPHLIRVKTQEYILLPEEDYVIGKSASGVNYTVDDNPAVSRVHCTIYKKNGAYYVRDERSTNSTYVNGEQVLPGTDHLLIHNCTLCLGNEEFTYLLW
jgi:hypothetical protein